MATNKKTPIPEGPVWINHTQTIGEYKWLVGTGVCPADVMIIGHYPADDDVANNAHFSGFSYGQLHGKAMECGVDLSSVYLTNVVKFAPQKKKPTAAEAKACRPMLEEEIRRVQPKLIICLGGDALKAVMGNTYKISTHRGVFLDHPELPGVTVFPTYSLSYSAYNPAADAETTKDWQAVGNWQNGETMERAKTEWDVTSNTSDVTLFVDYCINMAEVNGSWTLTLDCEWEGKHWMDPAGYLRTIQISAHPDRSFVIELMDENKQKLYDSEDIFKEVKRLFEYPKINLVGHNAIADGEWLLTYGIDIRKNTVFDTMIAEHTLNSAGTFNLTYLTEKYTTMGKYDVEVNEWVSAHSELTQHGYGAIPRDILIPYAAKDTSATYRVFQRQYPMIEEAGYLKPRGVYPSLFRSCLDAQMALYEIQRWGMKVDRQRVAEIANAYHTKLADLETKMVTLAAKAGMPEFNFKSVQQAAKLMFEVLGLTPIKATAAYDNKPWDMVERMADAEDVSPSTDKRTLDILQDQHPVAKILRDLRKIEHVCKTWLPLNYDPAIHDEVTKGGGVLSKIWPDGRVHASFSQLKETARFSSRGPNMQNFPKKAEGDIERIFGADNKPPDLRTMFVPEDGFVFVEADWKQAELFVLASLSGDQNMLDALRTPGKDLHDLTAISAFGLQVIDPDGNLVPEQFLLDLAQKDVNIYGTDEGHDFEAYQKQLRYVDQREHVMTRSEFKSTIRVSAKNLQT